MTARDFCYWLQGFFEVQDAEMAPPPSPRALTPMQALVIRRRLAMALTPCTTGPRATSSPAAEVPVARHE